MPQIQCKSCDYIFVDPCKDVVSLLALMMDRNAQPPEVKILDNRINNKREEIKNKGIVSMDDISVSINEHAQLTVKVRALVLQCINNHKHQYIVECK